MSANELENLMSQLHVQGELQIDTRSLGAGPTNAAGYTWAYDKEQTKYRNGAERIKPLPDNYRPRVYANSSPPYVPTLLPDLVDLDGKPLLVTKNIPLKADGHIDTAKIKDPELWKAMYFNEFYNRKGLGRKYYRAQTRLGRGPHNPMVPNEIKQYRDPKYTPHPQYHPFPEEPVDRAKRHTTNAQKLPSTLTNTVRR